MRRALHSTMNSRSFEDIQDFFDTQKLQNYHEKKPSFEFSFFSRIFC